ncbi:MAG: penicillin-binding protein 2 [Candidatus Spechtbacteria bacterium]|nr:penicillin-binding protein 2 [Candidatus Spechtbacteria bacterium]
MTKGGYYAALWRGEQSQYTDAARERGNIFFEDRFSELTTSRFGGANNTRLVATNKEWSFVYAVPKEIKDSDEIVTQLVPLLFKEESAQATSSQREFNVQNAKDELRERIQNRQDPYEPLAHRIDSEIVQKIKALNLEGIYIGEEKLRYYPEKSLASHTLGFVGYEGERRAGQYGVEGFYDEALYGDDLFLSLDYNIQFMLEKKLQNAKDQFDADGASGVVVNPKTGEIIALASADSFDPNMYSEVKNIDVFLNGITQKMFEPGSIFKPFTMAAALDTGAVSPATQYEDVGLVVVGDHTIRNAGEKTYGVQSMTNVLELSLNTGAVFAEKKLGHEKFREYAQRFGFGERTGVDLQGEVAGDMKNVFQKFRDVNFATASFGQGIAVSPIQLTSAFSAFANGGQIMKPHVVKEIGNRRVAPEIIGTPISPKTAGQITSMLVSVVENGHAKRAKVKGYKIAGKTGTAQVVQEGRKGYSDKTIHSFIGFAPAYNPRFVALVKLDNPKGVNFAESSAAPLFSEIAEYILHYYEIPPSD